MFTHIIHKSSLAVLLITLTAYHDKPKVAEQIRPLKAFTVPELVNELQRWFSGIVHATRLSSLSFEVSGKDSR